MPQVLHPVLHSDRLIVIVCAFLPNGIGRIANNDADVLTVQHSESSVIFPELRAEDVALLVVSEGVSPDHHLVRLVHFRRTMQPYPNVCSHRA